MGLERNKGRGTEEQEEKEQEEEEEVVVVSTVRVEGEFNRVHK